MNATVTELKAIAKQMGLKGYSKLTKSGLIALIAGEVSQLHAEALEMNAELDATLEVTIGFSPIQRQRKSYAERMISRLIGFRMQNGLSADVVNLGNYNSRDMLARLTPKQRKRVVKKQRAEYREWANY